MHPASVLFEHWGLQSFSRINRWLFN